MASLEELFSGVIEEKNVTIVKRVSYLESIYNISILLFHEFINLYWSESVLVEVIIELNLSHESSLRS